MKTLIIKLLVKLKLIRFAKIIDKKKTSYVIGEQSINQYRDANKTLRKAIKNKNETR